MHPPEAAPPPVKFVNVNEMEPVAPASIAPIMGWTPDLGPGDGLGVGLAPGVGVGVSLGVGLALGVGEGEGLAVTAGKGAGLGVVALHAGTSTANTAIKATTAATDPLTSPLRRIAPPSLGGLRVTLSDTIGEILRKD